MSPVEFAFYDAELSGLVDGRRSWIKPENSMRHLVWSRTDIDGGKQVAMDLAVPQPSSEDWRDYKDITVLAFPTPLDDTNQPLRPQSIRSNIDYPWSDF